MNVKRAKSIVKRQNRSNNKVKEAQRFLAKKGITTPYTDTPEPTTRDTEALHAMTCKDLRGIAKKLGLAGYSKARKADLITMVADAI